MLLVIDVGNSHTVLGMYEGPTLRCHWRLQTQRERTADEFGAVTRLLLDSVGAPRVTGVAISSVVPPLASVLGEFARTYVGQTPLFVGPGVRTGMAILYDKPQELGTDRLVNAVAAHARTGGATVVVDFGTATKIEYVSAAGAYAGGLIAPGIGIAADALFDRAARLYRVDIEAPPRVVGRNTIHALQSGLVFGFASMVDGLIGRVQAEGGSPARVIATGGFAPLLARHCRRIDEVDEFLTLDGLRLIYQRNLGQ